jgi:hypothetical protein
MFELARIAILVVLSTACALQAAAEDVVFEDSFDDGLSSQWTVIGLAEEDYRIRDGGLELRVAPRQTGSERPRIEFVLPTRSADGLTASVEITTVTPFTQPDEFAGLYLTDEDGPEFAAKHQLVDRRLVYAPGIYKFIGQSGEEGDPDQYAVTYYPVNDDFGATRIVVRGGYAYHQVGPSAEGKFLKFFHSAIQLDSKQRGFCLIAGGGPVDAEHWVRFDKFRIEK